jgi:hypothetical protein
VSDSDPTVRIAPSRAAPRAGRGPSAGHHGNLPLVLGAVVLAGAVAAGGAWWWRGGVPQDPPPKPDLPAPASHVPPRPGAAVGAPAASLPAIGPAIATQAEILANRAAVPTMFRLDVNPRIFVADFPNLDQQGAAFNRAAALIEKAGLPRDRVLDDAALAAAITRSGDTPGTYYFGHNYRGRDLERFFALADRDGIALTAEEAWLRQEVVRIRRLVPAPGEFAVISVPGLEERVDAAMRRAILQHEVGHGHFFTDARFATHVERTWREDFTEMERAAFRAFLAREGYDPAIEEVMMNEAMAYLIFTPDLRFFTPGHAGLTDARADALRAVLRQGAPR